MLYIFQELSILFLSTLTILFLLLITNHNNYKFFTIDTVSFQNEFSHFTHQPIKIFYTLIHKNSYLFRLISYIFICSFCSSLFFFLTKNFSLILSAILVLPLSLFLIYIFYYIIYFFFCYLNQNNRCRCFFFKLYFFPYLYKSWSCIYYLSF